MKNTQVTKICTVCNSPYNVKAYRADKSKYCSNACWSHRNPPIPKDCLYCGKRFISPDKSVRYCSRSCGRKNLTGERATHWKGGISLINKRSEAKGDLAKWRNKVYGRDNYTCQKCGKQVRELHAHHIKPVSEYPELIIDVTNGITVCVPCHELIHGRKLTTPAKYPKRCVNCGTTTTGRSIYCRSCSIRESWSNGNHVRSIR